ncbi:anti-sigma-28 factor, FlgM family [Lachnospiraceae bacterium KH1T2]|jgi:negative regulator of flagellin synthesis FlgM|nr:anti-sigma-28 factor, FlgM family [Lachnospiraceae bacterium KH1T2]
MRVEAYNQVMQIYGKQKSNKVNSSSSVSSAKDALELSEFGYDLQTAKKAVADAQDVREDLTAPLKAKIEAGTYDVSGESFADKLMAKLSELA